MKISWGHVKKVYNLNSNNVCLFSHYINGVKRHHWEFSGGNLEACLSNSTFQKTGAQRVMVPHLHFFLFCISS